MHIQPKCVVGQLRAGVCQLPQPFPATPASRALNSRPSQTRRRCLAHPTPPT